MRETSKFRTLPKLNALLCAGLSVFLFAESAYGQAAGSGEGSGSTMNPGAGVEPEVRDAGATMRVSFRGELLDDESRPLSGVFPLQFSFFRSAASEAPVWTELQYVAVFEGAYEVTLGRVEPIPAAWAGQRRLLEIAIGEAGVIASQSIVLTPWTPDGPLGGPSIRHERFVDLAGYAIRTDQASVARDCRTLGGQTATALDRYSELEERLNEVRARIDSPSRNRIGDGSVPLVPIGGTTGIPYERRCPPGYAMTGVRGGAGQVIDGLRIICTIVE